MTGLLVTFDNFVTSIISCKYYPLGHSDTLHDVINLKSSIPGRWRKSSTFLALLSWKFELRYFNKCAESVDVVYYLLGRDATCYTLFIKI